MSFSNSNVPVGPGLTPSNLPAVSVVAHAWLNVALDSAAARVAQSEALVLQYNDPDQLPAFWRRDLQSYRKRAFKSRYGKKTQGYGEDEDPDVDEACREEASDNDPQYERLLRYHKVKIFERFADKEQLIQ